MVWTVQINFFQECPNQFITATVTAQSQRRPPPQQASDSEAYRILRFKGAANARA